MKRLLAVLAFFALSVPAFAQADLQDVVDALDEVAELIAELNGRLGYSDQRYTVQGTLEDLASDFFYWTNNASRNPRGWPSGIRRDVLALGGLVSLTNVFHTSDVKLWIENPDGTYGFLPFYDESFPTEQFYVQDFTEFLALTMGQAVDSRGFNDFYHVDPDGQLRYAGSLDEAWEVAFNPWKTAGAYIGDMSFFSVWEAEAWRRLLALQTGSDVPAWTNNVAATNALDDVWTSAGYTNEDGTATGVLPSPGDVQLNTNAVTWFGGFDDPEPLVPKLDWTLTGDAYEVKLFGFEELEAGLTGSLSIDFADQPWPLVRKVMQFIFSVTFCVGAFMILRTELNYWTTLGGSST